MARNRFLWELFNLGFISIFQHVLIFLFASPVIVACVTPFGGELTPVDYAAAGIALTALAVETVADNQQWAFQVRAIDHKPLHTLTRLQCSVHGVGVVSVTRRPRIICAAYPSLSPRLVDMGRLHPRL